MEEILLAGFQNKDKGRIWRAYDKEDKIQTIKYNLERGVNEIMGVALRLCEWKNEHIWY